MTVAKFCLYRGYDVPSGWKKDTQLGSWVANQRSRRNKGLMKEERIRKLMEVPDEVSWRRNSRNNYRNLRGDVEYPMIPAIFHPTRGQYGIVNCKLSLVPDTQGQATV
jgi:hypothetical protein